MVVGGRKRNRRELMCRITEQVRLQGGCGNFDVDQARRFDGQGRVRSWKDRRVGEEGRVGRLAARGRWVVQPTALAAADRRIRIRGILCRSLMVPAPARNVARTNRRGSPPPPVSSGCRAKSRGWEAAFRRPVSWS